MSTQRRRRPTLVRPTLEPCEAKVLLSFWDPMGVSAGPVAASASVARAGTTRVGSFSSDGARAGTTIVWHHETDCMADSGGSPSVLWVSFGPFVSGSGGGGSTGPFVIWGG